jgi:uncharacterized protein YqgC (DUF456 family)
MLAMVSDILSFLGVAVVIIGIVVLRMMVARRVRRAVRTSRFGKNRVVQFAALGVVLLWFFTSLGAMSVVFIGLFLVVGTGLKIASLVNPKQSQPAGMGAPLSTSPRQAD